MLATRYVTALREGGSLPGLMEADDDGLYVVKFRGAGQGAKALVAELLAGELGRRLGLQVPRLVFVELDPVLGRAEPDPGDPGPARREPGAEPRSRLPARRALLRCLRRGRRGHGRAGGRHRLVRRPRGQRRPHAAQSQPAALARSPVVDRSRRRPLPPARRRASCPPRPARPSRRSPNTCCFPTPARSWRQTDGWRRAISAQPPEELAALIPRDVAGTPRQGLRRVAGRRLAPPRAFAQEAEDARAGR